MSDIFREVDEALKEDRAKDLWKKYGTWIITVVALIVLGTAGFVWWQDYRVSSRIQATGELVTALTAAELNPETGLNALEETAEARGNPYAAMARLNAAGLLANQGDIDGAVATLESVVESEADAVWRDLARVLIVLHTLDTADPTVLSSELEPLAADGEPWRFTARELQALLALRSGDTGTALERYTALAGDPETPMELRDRADRMVRQLGG